MEKPINGGISLLMQIARRRLHGKFFRRGCCYSLVISKLHQTGSFHEFLGEFEKLINCLSSWPESALMGAFMAGLKKEMAVDIRLLKPKNLQAAIELALQKR